MKKVSIFVAIFFIVALPLAIFTYCLMNTRVVPKNTIELTIQQGNSKNGSVMIDNISLDKLKEIIDEQSILDNQNSISEIFEKERAKYIELLTVVSILLTVFSLFSIVTGFLEKSETNKFKEELIAIKKSYTIELNNIKWSNLIGSINEMTQRTNQVVNFVFIDNSRVDSMEKYEKFLSMGLTNIMKSIQIEQLSQPYNLQSFTIGIYNYLLSSKNYANIKFQAAVSSINFATDAISKIFIIHIASNIPQEIFMKIKEQLNDLSGNTIIWGPY